MIGNRLGTATVAVLAIVFTPGLTFATIEWPHVVDDLMVELASEWTPPVR